MSNPQNPTTGSSPSRTQDSNKPGSTADELPNPLKSRSLTKRPLRDLVAELAPDKGFPETDFFTTFSEDGSRRSARARKPIARMSPEPVSPPPKPPKTKTATKHLPKRPRTAASNPLAAKASYTDTGRDKAPKEVEAGPSSAGTSETVATQAAEAYLSDSGSLDIPGLPTASCDRCNDVCLNCVSLTMSAVNLLKSPDDRNTWYIGPYGMFEIGPLRFPRGRKSVTYVRGRMSAETWATRVDAEAAGVELDSETDDDNDETARAESGVEMGHGDVVAAGSGLYSMMEPEDDETVGEEGGEGGEGLEEVDLEDLIKEWRDFCWLGQKNGWGPWLNGLVRPAHIDRKKWNERSRRRAAALNARYEAKIAANRARSRL
ncbi:hypothetical protein VC83_00706 [Pseudogymnoascus destructans]|uniref:Uncharacterized protein n=2 Tax=Pseudogymnoascus destructans TaxID=655981 RepID=L8GAS3_PSED2|nr:uncharacterized protein VC83_00706 [Pseudogymnoascus destructans]ELR10167.1 hypothetical protein GMDG_04561 [Pseudogymnoascus destructans 20631-21]OAF62707.1 hypothetical protein VC83_00706 [Pseudogymnoascus destructans]